MTVKDTKAVLRLGAVRAGESVRVRTLCPGLLGATPAQPLRASATEIYVEIGDGVRVTRPYRFTQNAFSGSMTVNWLLGATAKARASVFAPTDCYPVAGAVCKLKIFTAQEDASAKSCARLLQRGLPGYYTLQCADTDITNFCTVQGHAIRTMPDGRKICAAMSSAATERPPMWSQFQPPAKRPAKSGCNVRISAKGICRTPSPCRLTLTIMRRMRSGRPMTRDMSVTLSAVRAA